MSGEDTPSRGDGDKRDEVPGHEERRYRARQVEREAEQQPVDDDLLPAIDGSQDVDEPEEGLTHVRPFVGAVDTTPESEKVVTRIEIPIRTIVTVALSLFSIWVLLQIWGVLLQVVIAFLLATALLPLVKRLQQRGMSKGAASGIVFLGLVAAIIGFFWIILPPLINQAQSLIDNAPAYLDRFERFIRRYPSIQELYERLREQGIEGNGEEGGAGVPVNQAIQVSANVVERLANTFFVLILTFYLMLEGSSSWKFLSRYFTPRLRYRMRRSYPEISRVVSGYVVGQAINSFSFGLFAFIVLTILGVPEALLLGVLAGVFDAFPIVGVPVATIPAVLLALTVSWQTAVIVLVAYTIYQQFENYVMVPRVFGNTLQVSSLSILVGVLIGGQLLGIIGIILSLPLTAAIPVLERVWNEPLPENVIAAEAEEIAAQEAADKEDEQQMRRGAFRFRGGR
jgi:predicted PurR-regulated permease PerM